MTLKDILLAPRTLKYIKRLKTQHNLKIPEALGNLKTLNNLEPLTTLANLRGLKMSERSGGPRERTIYKGPKDFEEYEWSEKYTILKTFEIESNQKWRLVSPL